MQNTHEILKKEYFLLKEDYKEYVKRNLSLTILKPTTNPTYEFEDDKLNSH